MNVIEERQGKLSEDIKRLVAGGQTSQKQVLLLANIL